MKFLMNFKMGNTYNDDYNEAIVASRQILRTRTIGDAYELALCSGESYIPFRRHPLTHRAISLTESCSLVR